MRVVLSRRASGKGQPLPRWSRRQTAYPPPVLQWRSGSAGERRGPFRTGLAAPRSRSQPQPSWVIHLGSLDPV
eukprot:scaffold1142_cov387-Prasinococcus_capsulatus_cf.AAC.9